MTKKSLILIFLFSFLPLGEKAFAEKKFVKGEARFRSQDEDALSFIKGQLLDKSFRDVLSKEIQAMGLNSDFFWKNFQEKFEEHFRPIHEELREKFEDDEGKMKAKEREKYQKLLRIKRLKTRSKYGNLSSIIKSYVIKRMSRSLKYPNSRYMRLLAEVDRKRLRDFYTRFVKIGGKREFQSLYLDAEFDLQGLAWSDLGVETKADFTEVIKKHWMSWLKSRLVENIKEFKLVDAETRNKLTLIVNSHSLDNPEFKELSKGLWLKAKLQIRKIGENSLQKKKEFSFKGNYLLLDLKTQKPVDFYDFPKSSHEYSYIDNHQLSSNVASYVYRIPLANFERIGKKLEDLAGKENTLKLEVENVASVQEILELVNLIKEKGIVQNVDAQISLFDSYRALLQLDYNGEFNSLKKTLSALNQMLLSSGRSIQLKTHDNGLIIYLKGEFLRSEKIENESEFIQTRG